MTAKHFKILLVIVAITALGILVWKHDGKVVTPLVPVQPTVTVPVYHTLSPDEFPILVWDDADISNEGSRSTFDYYRIPAECFAVQKEECQIDYIRAHTALEKADDSGFQGVRMGISGTPISYDEWVAFRENFLNRYHEGPGRGYFVGYISVADNRLQSFNLIQGTQYENMLWPKEFYPQ